MDVRSHLLLMLTDAQWTFAKKAICPFLGEIRGGLLSTTFSGGLCNGNFIASDDGRVNKFKRRKVLLM